MSRTSLVLMALQIQYVFVGGSTFWRLSGIRYPDYYHAVTAARQTLCVSYCDIDTNCVSVNYNRNEQVCELRDHYPPDLGTLATLDPNWNVYYSYSDMGGENTVAAVDAWQITEEINHGGGGYALQAIDGNTDGDFYHNSCAHTLFANPNYWAAELASNSPIRGVRIYWRSECCSERRRDVQILVSRSRSDSDNGIGEECGYFGGPTTDISTTVMCNPVVYGSYVKIIQHYETWLMLCEVIFITNES